MPMLLTDLRLLNTVSAKRVDGDRLIAEAPPRTNAFINPADASAELTAPVLWTEAEGDFALKARVTVDLATTYDAAGLFVLADETHWLKVVREKTDIGHPAIVSVVTDGDSDDCNGEPWAADTVWLQVIRKGRLWVLHASADGTNWRMHRYLGLDWSAKVRVGLTVQSPLGDGCRATFDSVDLGPNPYRDQRSARL
jgi:uncharacterized protein